MSGEQDELKVSLEPPKLFGRKKKSGKSETESAPEPGESPTPPVDATPTEAPEPPEPSEPSEPERTPPRVEADETEVIETGPDAATDAASYDRDTTTVLPPADDEPIIDEIETGLDDEEDDLAPTPVPAAAPAGPSLADRIRERLTRSERPGGEARPDQEDSGGGSAYTAPMLDNYRAAVLTGAIVGLGMVVLTWLSLRGCEAIRGTASCGGGPGFLLLVAMFIVSVMLGSAILKSFEVPDPGSSSFLAVGLVAVVALLLLIDVLDHWSMLLVVPVITVGAYLLSVYITKTFVEPGDQPRP